MRHVQKVLTLNLKTGINNEWNIFFKIVHLESNILTPVSFSFVEAPLKLLFIWCKTAHYISRNVLHILKSYHWDEFSVYETRKSSILYSLCLVNMECTSLAQSCVYPQTAGKIKQNTGALSRWICHWIVNHLSGCLWCTVWWRLYKTSKYSMALWLSGAYFS